jgi:hypothetical protein
MNWNYINHLAWYSPIEHSHVIGHQPKWSLPTMLLWNANTSQICAVETWDTFRDSFGQALEEWSLHFIGWDWLGGKVWTWWIDVILCSMLTNGAAMQFGFFSLHVTLIKWMKVESEQHFAGIQSLDHKNTAAVMNVCGWPMQSENWYVFNLLSTLLQCWLCWQCPQPLHADVKNI